MSAHRFMGEAVAEAGGRRWKIRLDFNALADMEEATGRGALDLLEDYEAGKINISGLRALLHACLLRHQPDATLFDAGDILTEDPGAFERALAAAQPKGDAPGVSGAARGKRRAAPRAA